MERISISLFLSFFRKFGILLIFSIFLVTFLRWLIFTDENKSFNVTINDETYYCQSYDLNEGRSVLFLSESSKPYVTLYLDDGNFINIEKSYPINIETLYRVPEPNFFEYLVGDYDE